MNICGIDQSFTSTAICIFNSSSEELIFFKIIKSVNKDKTQEYSTELRIKEIIDEILRIIEEYRCEYVFLEGLSFKSVNSRSTRDLGGLFYSLLISFMRISIPYQYFSPKTVKAFADKGNASKEEIYDKIPDNIKDLFTEAKIKKTTGLYDLSDAYFIGKLGIKKLKDGEI